MYRSCVAFDGKKRIIGVAAKNQQVTNMKNTVSGFKRLLGRKYNDPHVLRELSTIPTKVEALPDGSIGFCVNYLDKEQSFTPEQLTAMLFTKLKETSSNALGAQVSYERNPKGFAVEQNVRFCHCIVGK